MLAAILLPATVAFAGGFFISVEAPASVSDPDLKDAVLVVRPYGCHVPTDAALTVTAEGLVNGKRQSLPVKIRPMSTGVFAIDRQWPSEGTWVLAITGEYRGITSSALVKLGANGDVQVAGKNGKLLDVQIVQRKLTADDVEKTLNGVAVNLTRTPQESGLGSSASLNPTPWLAAGLGALAFLASWTVWKRRRVSTSRSSDL